MFKRAGRTAVALKTPSLALTALLGALAAASGACDSTSDAASTDGSGGANCTLPTTTTTTGDPTAPPDEPPHPPKAGPLQSVSRIAFGPPDVLFAADWKDSKLHAFKLPPATGASDQKSFNIKNLESTLAADLGGEPLAFEDVVTRPGSNEVYMSASIGAAQTPAIFMAKADGTVKALDLDALEDTTTALDNAPDESLKFWRTIPGRSFTVTDMKWRDGKLYVAGISNQAFASTLRVLPYPFGAGNAMATVEMYHTVHNQMETRAPIRAMNFVELGGKTHLLAAYLCTPLVTIPLDEVTDGAHVQAKTIAELGYAGIPTDIIPVTMVDFQTGNPVDYVMITNLHRQSALIPLSSIEEANAGPGYATPVSGSDLVGVSYVGEPMSPAYRMADQDQKFYVVLRRDLKTGQSELVSYNKNVSFRLSDFDVSEFLFPDYQYDAAHVPTMQFQNGLKTDEGYPELVRQQ